MGLITRHLGRGGSDVAEIARQLLTVQQDPLPSSVLSGLIQNVAFKWYANNYNEERVQRAYPKLFIRATAINDPTYEFHAIEALAGNLDYKSPEWLMIYLARLEKIASDSEKTADSMIDRTHNSQGSSTGETALHREQLVNLDIRSVQFMILHRIESAIFRLSRLQEIMPSAEQLNAVARSTRSDSLYEFLESYLYAATQLVQEKNIDRRPLVAHLNNIIRAIEIAPARNMHATLRDSLPLRISYDQEVPKKMADLYIDHHLYVMKKSDGDKVVNIVHGLLARIGTQFGDIPKFAVERQADYLAQILAAIADCARYVPTDRAYRMILNKLSDVSASMRRASVTDLHAAVASYPDPLMRCALLAEQARNIVGMDLEADHKRDLLGSISRQLEADHPLDVLDQLHNQLSAWETAVIFDEAASEYDKLYEAERESKRLATV